MDDLIDHKVDILTLGQYLRPTLNHLPVERWLLEEFEKYREIELAKASWKLFQVQWSGQAIELNKRCKKIMLELSLKQKQLNN